MAPHLNQDEVAAASDSRANLGSDRPKKATTSEVTLPDSTSPDETQPTEAPSPVSTAQLFRYADKKDKSLMTTGVVAAILSSAVMPVIIVLFGNVTDAMAMFALNSTADGSADLNTEMDYFVYGAIATAAFQQLTSLTFVFCFYYAASRQARRIKQLFLRSALRQDISWYDTKQMGDFTTRVTEDLKKMEDGMGEKIGMCLVFLAIFMFGIGLSFYKGWKLTLVISSFIPLMVITGGFMSKLQADCAQREAQAYSEAGALAEEAIGAIRTVVAFGGQQKELDRYSESLRGASRAMVARSGVTAVGVGLVWLVQFSLFTLAFWYGTKLVLQSRETGDGLYSPGTLTIVFFSILIGAMNMGQAAPHIEALSSAKSAAATVFSVIERESDIDPSGRDGVQPDRVEGLVELKDVHFSYPSRPDTQVLHGVSFVVRPGQTVALVGTSGCGKSTCIQLIQRFYDPSKGEVLLDGRRLSELNVSWLRRQIGVVSQEPVLFGTTIAENIRYGSPDCSMEDIEQAARQANAFDFIQSLPEKFDTLVGQRGAQLSGGQKQRIAIARALVRNPAVFLLDEATSALDLRSEAVVQAAIDKARRGRTTIVVAHRLSTIRSADVICAVKDGRVVEVGSHDQLMQQNGVYCSLVTSQTVLKIEEDDQEPDGSDANDPSTNRPRAWSGQQPRRTVSSAAERADEGAGGTDVVSNGSTDDFKSAPAASKARSRVEEDEAALPAISGWRILSLNRREWPYLLLGVLGAAGMGSMIPGYAVIFGAALGNLSVADPDEAMSNAKLYGLLFLAVGAVAFTASFVQIFMFGIAGERLTTRVRKLIFSTLLRQEIGYFDDVRHSVGVLCTRLSGDAAALQGATGTRLGNVTQAVFTVLLGMAMAFYLSWQLALAALPFVPLCALATYVESRQNSGVATGERTELETGNQIAVEAISNIRTVASLGLEEMFADQYEKRLASSHRKYMKKAFFRGLVYGGAQCVPMLAYAVLFGVSKHMILDKTIPYSHLFVITESLVYGTAMVGAAVAFSPDFNKAFDAAKRVFALLDRKSAIDSSHSSGLKPPSVSGRIALKGVAFRYPSRPEAPVLRDLSLEVSPGQQVALVGASGCGKSTCIQLLERFYDADEGDVTLDGHRVSALNLSWLRSNIGIVSQEPVLFDRTIAENIAYGDNSREVPMEDIITAARDANVHSFVTSLPAGYETRLGSSSSTQLSGGQKQRVAIARALLRRPAVLLLDEATSALDAQSEKSVQEALDRAASGRTCLVIAHRLSTIRGADRIAVMHRGRVVEQGSHQELLTRRGVYYNLYRTNA